MSKNHLYSVTFQLISPILKEEQCEVSILQFYSTSDWKTTKKTSKMAKEYSFGILKPCL